MKDFIARLCYFALPLALGAALVYGLILWSRSGGDFSRPHTYAAVGIKFSYPERYNLSEKLVEPDHYQITLAEPEKEIPADVPREAPPSITIDIFDDAPAGKTLADWLESEPRSNYHLAIDKYSSTTVDRQAAFSYVWDGLYRGDSTAVAVNERVYILSVTYLNNFDRIKNDFDNLLGSVKFIPD